MEAHRPPFARFKASVKESALKFQQCTLVSQILYLPHCSTHHSSRSRTFSSARIAIFLCLLRDEICLLAYNSAVGSKQSPSQKFDTHTTNLRGLACADCIVAKQIAFPEFCHFGNQLCIVLCIDDPPSTNKVAVILVNVVAELLSCEPTIGHSMDKHNSSYVFLQCEIWFVQQV